MPRPNFPNLGLNTDDLHQLVDILTDYKKQAPNVMIYAFGSRARGNHQKFSDLDLLFDPAINYEHLGELREKFEESNLDIKVDLVSAADLAPDYLRGIERDKIYLGI